MNKEKSPFSNLPLKTKNGGTQYQNNRIFELFKDIVKYYDLMSNTSNPFSSSIICVRGENSIDSTIFTSIMATVLSIETLTTLGHLNDAFALARKYQDAVLTHICVAIEMKKITEEIGEKLLNSSSGFSPFNNILQDWCDGEKNRKRMKDVIFDSEYVNDLNLFFSDFLNNHEKTKSSQSIILRQFSNNNIHYNGLEYFKINDIFSCNEKCRLELLVKLENTILDSFIMHFAYVFELTPEYYCSNDYVIALELGIEPDEKSKYDIAYYFGVVFNKYISKNLALADYLKNCNYINL